MQTDGLVATGNQAITHQMCLSDCLGPRCPKADKQGAHRMGECRMNEGRRAPELPRVRQCATAAQQRDAGLNRRRKLQIDNSREDGDRQDKNQPFEVVPCQIPGEMQDQDSDGDDVEQHEKHRKTLSVLGLGPIDNDYDANRPKSLGSCHQSTKRIERSSAVTSLVKAPTEMRSTPVSAIPRSVSSETLPDASSTARPAVIWAASCIMSRLKLSSRIIGAPAARACSSSARLSTSTWMNLQRP